MGRVPSPDMEEKNSTLEEELWSFCNKLRPKMEAAEYKHVILRIYSLFALSNINKSKLKRVKMPTGTTWNDVRTKVDKFTSEEKGKGTQLGAAKHFDRIMIEVAESNSEITDCFPPVFERLLIDNKTIQELMEGFTTKFENEDPGVIYQFFLRKFAEDEGRGGGEFFTPESILDVMVRMLNFTEGTIYEPCFGAGSMVVACHKHAMKTTDSKKQVLKFYGQEANSTNFHLGKVHVFLTDIEVKFERGDTLLDDKFKPKASGSIANPPFNLKSWTGETTLDVDPETEEPVDPRWRKWGLPPKGNANFAWMEHIDHHCVKKPRRWGIVFSRGTLSNADSSKIRKQMIEGDEVLCVLALPIQLFTNTPIAAAIWIGGQKPKHRKDQTLFINAHGMGKMKTRTLRILEEEEIEKIANTFLAWTRDEGCNEEYEDELGFCKTTAIEEIREHNSITTPGRYVGIPPIKEDGEPFEERMARLTRELNDHFGESRELENQIRESMEEFGFEL